MLAIAQIATGLAVGLSLVVIAFYFFALGLFAGGIGPAEGDTTHAVNEGWTRAVAWSVAFIAFVASGAAASVIAGKRCLLALPIAVLTAWGLGIVIAAWT